MEGQEMEFDTPPPITQNNDHTNKESTPTETQKSEVAALSSSQGATQTAQPLSEWEQLRRGVEQDPYNTVSWDLYVTFAEGTGDLEKIKEAFEALLARYPNIVRLMLCTLSVEVLTHHFQPSAQIAYLSHFLTNPSSFGYAESLFARFLRTSPSVDLWKYYITYVRSVSCPTHCFPVGFVVCVVWVQVGKLPWNQTKDEERLHIPPH